MISSRDSDALKPNRKGQTIIDAATSRKSRHQTSPEEDSVSGIHFLSDVRLRVSVVLAETHMPVRELLSLGTDSVVQMDKLSGDPVDIYVENQKLAKGEVIVLQEKLRIRLLEIVHPSFYLKPPETEE